jgi:hypothetical protein
MGGNRQAAKEISGILRQAHGLVFKQLPQKNAAPRDRVVAEEPLFPPEQGGA